MLTASQSLKLYGIVQRYFNKEEDAQAFVSEIENAIDKNMKQKRIGLQQRRIYRN